MGLKLEFKNKLHFYILQILHEVVAISYRLAL